MKKLVIGFAVATFALVSSTCFADDAKSGSKVAVVQVPRILQDAPIVKETTAKLKKQFAAEQKSIEASQKALQGAMEDLKKNDSVMSKEDKAAAEKKIAADRQTLVGQISAFQQKVSKAQSDAMKEIFDSLNLTIQAYADANDIDVMLDSQNVLYAVETADVTDDIEKAFNDETAKKSKK